MYMYKCIFRHTDIHVDLYKPILRLDQIRFDSIRFD